MRKANYETETEKNALIAQAEQNGEYIIEDAILSNEKYLIFDVTPLEPPQLPTQEERLEALEVAMLELVLGGAD